MLIEKGSVFHIGGADALRARGRWKMNLRIIAGLVTKTARPTTAGGAPRAAISRATAIEDMLRRRPLELSTDRC